eukprot:9149078-Ditylum_brightwellii.AAC.1
MEHGTPYEDDMDDVNKPLEIIRSGDISAQDACHLAVSNGDKPKSSSLTLILLYGSWNKLK